MNDHALEVLEFTRALARVAERTTCTPAREAILGRAPDTDPQAVAAELERVRQTMEFVEHDPGWGLPVIPDVRAPLHRLHTAGSVVSAGELHQLGLLLTACREVESELARRLASSGAGGSGEGAGSRAADDAPLPALRVIRRRLPLLREMEKRIGRTVAPDGAILDGASRELARIRSQRTGAERRIVKRLDAYMAQLPERYRVADASVTVREGRYVIPLRREGRGEVGGIIHDESGTGATVFVEPPVAVELMNELRELERREEREIQRILREISDELHPRADELEGALAALVDFDTLHARARIALAWNGAVPEVLPVGAGTLTLVRARHPLLLFRHDVETVVPYDLELGERERTLVVSGPNTGGKSVFLKAVGLLALLTQSGIVPPVGKGTALPVFTNVFADIGDEQSIAESLSTFSAHLENLKEIVASADEGSLVLMDEMGTGTDPTEGAALARAIIESLTERRSLSVVTSHLGALKTLAGEDSGIVNASLAFDAARMEPTYHLLKGRPGRSYGLAIARRLGFDEGLLDRAEALVDEGAASLEELLERLETQEREARERAERTAALEAEVAGLKEELEVRRRKLQERERTAEQRARDQARQLLLNAREQVEKAIDEVKATAPASPNLDEAARAARRRVEEAARRQREKRPSSRTRPGAGGARQELTVGARVRLPGTGKTKGTVAEIRDGRATVDVGGLRMEVGVEELEVLEPAPGEGSERAAGRSGGTAAHAAASREDGAGRRAQGWSGTVPAARHEVDLRGLRVDEVETELGRAVDAAVIGNLPELRIIHGKGTGAVRSRVQELLELDRRVEDFRLGLAGEGGSGVTVARLGGAA